MCETITQTDAINTATATAGVGGGTVAAMREAIWCCLNMKAAVDLVGGQCHIAVRALVKLVDR